MSDAVYQIAGKPPAPGLEQIEPEKVAGYIELMKPRVMSLVVFTAFAGLIAAPGQIDWFIALVAILCTAGAAGSAGAINMWYDADIDAQMARTAARPIPSGQVQPAEALTLGVILGGFSCMFMGLAVNWFASALLLITILFYVVVYTAWLKRRTPQNIVIGGAAGAFPPMIGWAAVTGGTAIEPIIMFAIIFLWTPPHFWALALYKEKEFAQASLPMLPNVAGARATKWQMLAYTLILLPVGMAPAFLGTTGWVYGAAAAVIGGLFVLTAVRVLQARPGDLAPARRMFAFSILHLFLLFALVILDARHGPLNLFAGLY